MSSVEWDVQLDEDFRVWLHGLDAAVRIEISASVKLLKCYGPQLGRPHVDTVKGSAFPSMKELRVSIQGEPWRVLFAFDPERSAVLLIGGNKQSDKRWYKRFIPIADERFRRHLKRLEM